MQSYLVTLQTGRMLLVQAPGPNLARAAAHREASRLGLAPDVKHVAELSEDTAAILHAGNKEPGR